jgi:hypothetical protein
MKTPKNKKQTAKRKKPLLTKEQRTAVSTLAALKAHCHKSFQSMNRSREEQSEQRKAYVVALKAFNKRYPSLARAA